MYPVDIPFYSGSGGVNMNSGTVYKDCTLMGAVPHKKIFSRHGSRGTP